MVYNCFIAKSCGNDVSRYAYFHGECFINALCYNNIFGLYFM